MIRNLIYHIAPFKRNDAWKQNIRQLLARIDLFNGKRIVGIVTGDDLVPAQVVQDALGPNRIEFVVLKNDPLLCEASTFYTMLTLVRSTRSDEWTFYAHAKGSSRLEYLKEVTWWRNSMYHFCLDNPARWNRIAASDQYDAMGCFRVYHVPGTLRKHRHLSPDLRTAEWHYSGTFYWFRHSAIFEPVSEMKWKWALPSKFVSEFWLQKLVPHGRAYCLYADNPFKDRYDVHAHALQIDDDEEPWRWTDG